MNRTMRSLIFLVLGLALPWLAGLVPWAVEATYGRIFFPGVAGVINVPSAALPFSLVQILLILAVAGMVLFLVRCVRVSIRDRSVGKGFGPLYRWILGAGILVWTFHLLWGLNYSRPPLIERLPLVQAEPSPAALARLTRVLAEETNRTYRWGIQSGQISPDTLGSHLQVPRRIVSERLTSAYSLLLPGYDRINLSLPKSPYLLSLAMTRLGISGFYFPLTGEASFNGQVPDPTVPSIMAHEMAHQRGAAPEDEANFWAFLACRESGLPAARYSGALQAFRLTARALYRADRDLYQETIPGILEPGPGQDILAINRFWRRYSGPASAAAHRANHAYLQMNTQREGTRTYGEAVRLFLAWEASGGFDGAD